MANKCSENIGTRINYLGITDKKRYEEILQKNKCKD